MNRKHATLIALILGLATVFGVFAAVRTAHLGSSARGASAAALAAQQRQLTAAEKALHHALAQKSVAGKAAPRTVYVRPAPIIVHLHRHGDDGEGEGGSGD